MKDSFSWLTPKQAGELAGFTARHIQNLICQGKLSATKEDGKYYIERSEFFRLFPKAHKKEQEGNITQQLAEKERLEFENNLLKNAASQKDKEIEFLRNQISYISQEKIKMLDTIVNTTRLLEYKSTEIKEKENEKIEKKSSKNWKGLFKLKKD